MTRMEALVLKSIDLAMKGNARVLTQVFDLYAVAVPEQAAAAPSMSGEEQDATDLAIIEAFKADCLRSVEDE
jgi:hypothetical protein